MEHLCEKLKEYAESDFYPYHMPGHKRSTMGSMSAEIMKLDITEIEGFDNLHEPEGILKGLQERAAALYGAEESFYLVNGSTCGILSAISAATSFGGHILMARNSHKSAYHGVYIRNLKTTYLYPPMLNGYDICDAITPQQIKAALEKEPDIEAVFLVSPTYEGRLADVAAIAGVVHEKGLPLIVDEAHGAHLGLAEGFAPNSNQAGADLVIHSVHKTLPAMTQTALLHVNGNRIDRERLRRFLHIYQSSSPSYVLMASIDNALRLVEEQGCELFAKFRCSYQTMLKELSHCKRLRFVPCDEKRQDVGKLVIDCRKAGLTGRQLYQILFENYHLQLEMACGSYCLAMFTIGDTEQAYERMTRALLEIDKQAACNPYEEEKTLTQPDMEGLTSIGILPTDGTQALLLAEAWDMPWEQVELEAAVGRRVADFVNLYPPGVPILVPGEVLSWEQYLQIREYLEQGLKVQGVQEQDLQAQDLQAQDLQEQDLQARGVNGNKKDYQIKCINIDYYLKD